MTSMEKQRGPLDSAGWRISRRGFCAAAGGWLAGMCSGAAPAASPTAAATQKPKKLDFVGEINAKLEPTRQVVYKSVGGRSLHLHLFEPRDLQPGDRRPCFLTIHGGGWTGYEPRRQYAFAAHFATLGMVGMSLEYRLAKQAAGVTVFDCVKDARSAVRLLRAHAAELRIDPQKIIANGGSAGGHLAAGTALFGGIDEPGEDVSVSCVPNALVLYYPVIDTSERGYGNARIGDRWREISPLHRVRNGVPPTIVFHGTRDASVPYQGVVAFRDAMLQAGNRCELVTGEGGAHGYLMFDRAAYEETLRKTEAFLVSLRLLDKKDEACG